MNNSATPNPRSGWYFLALILALLGLGAGIVWIFRLTFQPGSIYPSYSSLRTDPLGTRLFYHSLGRLSGSETARSHLPLTQVEAGSGEGVFFFLGIEEADLEMMSLAEVQALEKWLDQGWRLVFALKPQQGDAEKKAEALKPVANKAKASSVPEKSGQGEKRLDYYPRRRVSKVRQEKQLQSSYFKMVSLMNRWDLRFETVPFPSTEEGGSGGQRKDEVTDHLVKAQPVEGSGLDGDFPLFSETVVRFHSKDWTPFFRRGAAPVVLERKFGRGSVVFITDTYAFSNQSLAQEPALSLMEWCLDGRSLFVFDEFHHGLEASPGVMSLARALRLEGLFGGLFLLAFLLVWRASRSFPPVPKEAGNIMADEETASPRDHLDGLANLLQRGIAPKSLLDCCLKEWRQSTRLRNGPDEIPDAAVATDSGPALVLDAFNRLHQHLNRKKRL